MAKINGKELMDVLAEIQKPCVVERKSKEKYSYYGIEVYEQRLDSAVGKANYNASYTEPQCIVLPGNQVVLMVRCILNFLDDTGNIAYRAEGIGSVEITYSDKNGSYINLNNSGYCLQAAAFKSACKGMDMFGIHADKEEKPKAESKDAGKKAALPQDKGVFYTSGAFEVVRTDTNTGKPVYKVLANRVVDNLLQIEPVTILFYPNQYKNCPDKVNSYVSLCGDGKQHKILIKYSVSTYQSDTEQLIFKGFWQ